MGLISVSCSYFVFSGFSRTDAIGVQFRVARVHRRGVRALALV